MLNIKCGNKTFTNVEAILFDKNGTLEDSEICLRSFAQKATRIIDSQIPGIGEPLLMAFGVNGDILDHAGLMAVASRRESEIAAAAYIAETGRAWIEALTIARQALEEADKYAQNIPSPLFDGCLEVIQQLSGYGLKLGILSAATTSEVYTFAQTTGLNNYMQLLMGVDEGVGKPDPKLFLLACEQLGVSPNKTLMVGDSIGDMQMAKNAGAAGCIGISWIGKADNVRGADVFINNLNAIQVIPLQVN